MTDRPEPISRTTFLRRASGLFALAVFDRSGAASLVPPPGALEHPEPRAGITAERVLAADALGSSRSSKVAEAYEAARTWPAIFDGIACGCSCGGKKAMHRSLLVCFETMQPTGCGACQLEAELVGKLASEDRPLADIRKAVDKDFS